MCLFTVDQCVGKFTRQCNEYFDDFDTSFWNSLLYSYWICAGTDSLTLSVYPSVCLCINLSVFLSIFHSCCLSACLFLCLTESLFPVLSFVIKWIFFCLSFYLSFCLSLSVCLFLSEWINSSRRWAENGDDGDDFGVTKTIFFSMWAKPRKSLWF